MFIWTFYLQANEEQRNKWFDTIENYNIHGCYAQTELGHGSDIAGLETTATFDHKTDEFVIHTPTITATKWWPGGVGRVATHALVAARIKIPDPDDPADVNDYGLGFFIV